MCECSHGGSCEHEDPEGWKGDADVVAAMERLRKRVAADEAAREVRRPCDICWATPGAAKWRTEARAMAFVARGFTRPEQVRESLGPKWAHRMSNHFGDWEPHFVDDLWERMEAIAHKGKPHPKAAEKFERELTDVEIETLNRDLATLREEAEMFFNW